MEGVERESNKGLVEGYQQQLDEVRDLYLQGDLDKALTGIADVWSAVHISTIPDLYDFT
jgi:hypothetical protein